MIISRTPLRISFVGGGSDIQNYYQQSPGAVVSTAIDKYIYIMVGKQFDGRIIAQYSKIEVVKHVSDIENNLIREAMKITKVTDGIHITSISDVPAEGTGLGSSSSYIVGLLNALYAYQGKQVAANVLAQQACDIEIRILKKPIGKQDQYIAAFGGFQFLQFQANEYVAVDPVVLSERTKATLNKRLILFYTKRTRSADAILAKQTKNLDHRKEHRDRTGEMVQLAHAMRKMLHTNRLASFGKVLDQNWELKKHLADGITDAQIDGWYKKACRAGATGGKILGAGGGGFLLLYALPQYHEKIRRALGDLVYLPFSFEPQGSKIIFVGE